MESALISAEFPRVRKSQDTYARRSVPIAVPVLHSHLSVAERRRNCLVRDGRRVPTATGPGAWTLDRGDRDRTYVDRGPYAVVYALGLRRSGACDR